MNNKNSIWNVEVTDTFGGEANYAWVKRETIVLPENASNLAIVRAAKRAMGWNGVRCKVENYGDSFTLRPSGLCQVLFITYSD